MRTTIDKSIILQLAANRDISISNKDLKILSIQINSASEDLLKLNDMISVQTVPWFSFEANGS